VIKSLSVALTAALAAASVTAFADDTSGATATHVQQCVAKEKAKNDGRSEAAINQACMAKVQKYQSQPDSSGMTPPTTTTPSSPAPSSPNYPSSSTPNDTTQVPK
jgi:hypothetical protein